MVSVPARREPGDVCDAPGTVAAAGLHADEGGAFGARLPIDEGSAGMPVLARMVALSCSTRATAAAGSGSSSAATATR
jgi:hypothetical protein